MVKPSTKKTKRKVAHCTLAKNARFKSDDGTVYNKFAIKRGMTDKGIIVKFNDSDLVEKLN